MRKLIVSIARAIALMGAAAVVSNSANASVITVDNPSFETLPSGGLPNGSCGVACSYSIGPIPGWNDTGFSGQFQPGSSSGNFAYFNSVPDGITVGYSNGGTISQTVGPTSVAGLTYTLQVFVGQRNDGNYSPSLIELVVGSNTILATGILPTPGNWSDWTASYTATASGQPISINLISSGLQGDWDKVSLTATTPLPSTWTMLIAGFVGLGFFAYRGTKKGAAAIAVA
jgi:hypothetical protein